MLYVHVNITFQSLQVYMCFCFGKGFLAYSGNKPRKRPEKSWRVLQPIPTVISSCSIHLFAQFPINIMYMSLNNKGQQEYSLKSHTEMGRTCKFHPEQSPSGFKSFLLKIQRQNTTYYAIWSWKQSQGTAIQIWSQDRELKRRWPFLGSRHLPFIVYVRMPFFSSLCKYKCATKALVWWYGVLLYLCTENKQSLFGFSLRDQCWYLCCVNHW